MKELQDLRKSNVEKVSGANNNHLVQLVTISTCIWCKRIKSLLNENDIEYEYTDIDMLPRTEKDELKTFLYTYKSRLAFPMCFIDGELVLNTDSERLVRRLTDGN